MEESSELKAGHAPAQKVGGMRIVQHKHKEEKHEGSPPKMSDEDKEEFGEDRPAKSTAVRHSFKNPTFYIFHLYKTYVLLKIVIFTVYGSVWRQGI